jgi:hypothetical protein
VTDPQSEVDQLLGALRFELRSLGRRARGRALDEARDHLLSVVEDQIAAGSARAEAERRAVERFGSPSMVAMALRATPRRSPGRFVPVLIGAALIIGVVTLPAGPVKDEFTPPAALAASPADLTKAQCADFWNDAANARWHAYAKSIGTRRAAIGAGFTETLGADGQPLLWTAECTVRLWLALRPGHWQQAVLVYGRLVGGEVLYGTSLTSRNAPPVRSRQRATIQWSNSVVRRNGTLAFYGPDRSCLPSHCYRDGPAFLPAGSMTWLGLPPAWSRSLPRSPLAP